MQIAVMGAGSWGTAFAHVLADAGNDVRLWGRRPEVCDMINALTAASGLPCRAAYFTARSPGCPGVVEHKA